MSENEIAITEVGDSAEPAELIPLDDNMIVLARDPHEMRAGQAQLIGWFSRRVEQAKAELEEAEENREHARKRKWAIQGWSRQVNLAKSRLNFYEKCCTALEEGYCIVPDFPTDIFAIRTTNKEPKPNVRTTRSWRVGISDQRTNSPPVGDGAYVSPQAKEGLIPRLLRKANVNLRKQLFGLKISKLLTFR